MIDCVILSYARTRDLYRMTQTAINSLVGDFDGATIYVVETGNVEPYKSAQTIFPKTEFNYNKFLKIGVSSGTNPYVFVLNNDIRAHKGCMKELIRWLDTYHSVSPMNPLMPQHKRLEVVNEGMNIWHGKAELCGWAIMLKRQTIDMIGMDKLWDDRFKFWFQDNAYAEVLKQRGMKHALIGTAKLDHYESKTLHGQENKQELTHDQKERFDNWLASLE